MAYFEPVENTKSQRSFGNCCVLLGTTNLNLFQLNRIVPLLPVADYAAQMTEKLFSFFIRTVLLPVNGFHIKMTLCNLSYTCSQSWYRGTAEADQKAHSATHGAIIVARAQKRSPDYFDVKPDNFSVEGQWGVWRGRSRCLSSAVNAALWFSSPLWWELNSCL